MAFLNALEHARDAHLNEFVEVGGGNRKKFHPFEKGIGPIAGFFEHATVEVEPGTIAGDEKIALRFVHRVMTRPGAPPILYV